MPISPKTTGTKRLRKKIQQNFGDGNCKIDKYGQVIIPKKIRDRIAMYLGTGAEIPLKIRLMESGVLELAPTMELEVSFYMENHPEILEAVAESVEHIHEGKFVPRDEIEKLLTPEDGK